MGQRCAQLRAHGCSRVVPFGLLYWKHPVFLPHYAMDLPHRLLEDADTVRAVFDSGRTRLPGVSTWHRFDGAFITISTRSPIPSRRKIYFPTDIFLTQDDEVFVDCGAFDGDTLRLTAHH